MPKPDSEQLMSVLAKFPASVAQRLAASMQCGTFCGMLPAAEAQLLARNLGVTMYQLMLELTAVAALYAVTPISHFAVGAVAQGLSGNLYYGSNMEFAGEALTCCTHAEQSATVNAWVQGEQGLLALAVSAAPCGYCRQFLYELVTAARLTLIFNEASGQTLTESMAALLPWAFGPQDFGVQGGLMAPQNHQLVLAAASDDAGVHAALRAANMCYAPYSRSFAGIGVVLRNGTVYAAPLAENAGYNPSLSPLEGALSHMNVCDHTYDQIQEVALVEVAGGQASQANVTRAVLSAVSPVALTTASAVPSGPTSPSQERA